MKTIFESDRFLLQEIEANEHTDIYWIATEKSTKKQITFEDEPAHNNDSLQWFFEQEIPE